MLPTPVKRVQYYNRTSHENYVYWLLDQTGVPFDESLLKTRSRNIVDEYVLRKMENGELVEHGAVLEEIIRVPEPEPTWVEAAKSALGDIVDDVEDAIEELFHDEEVEEEVMIVPDADNPFGGEMDYNSYTVRELQQECKTRGITIRGTKSEVVLRLRRDDMGIVEQPTQAESEAPSQEAADEKAVAPSQEAASKDVTQYDDSRQEQPDNEEE